MLLCLILLLALCPFCSIVSPFISLSELNFPCAGLHLVRRCLHQSWTLSFLTPASHLPEFLYPLQRGSGPHLLTHSLSSLCKSRRAPCPYCILSISRNLFLEVALLIDLLSDPWWILGECWSFLVTDSPLSANTWYLCIWFSFLS